MKKYRIIFHTADNMVVDDIIVVNHEIKDGFLSCKSICGEIRYYPLNNFTYFVISEHV